MRILLTGLMAALILGAFALPAEAQTSVSDLQSVTLTNKGLLRDETIGILPQVGAFAFKDVNNSQASRAAIGVGFDFNLANLEPHGPRDLFAGISTGAIYSPIGGADANFFGNNGSSAPASADAIIIPADVKLGYNLSDRFRIGAHGGANAIFTSQPGLLQFGNSNHWNFFPNVGADLDIGFTTNVAVGIRPDFTFTPGSQAFTGTVQFGYIFG